LAGVSAISLEKMMKTLKLATVALGVLGISAGSFAQAQFTNLELYFTLKGDTTPVTEANIGVAGKPGNMLEVSVWARFVKALDLDSITVEPFAHNYANVFVATGTKADGESPVETFSMGSDMMSSVSDFNSIYDSSNLIVSNVEAAGTNDHYGYNIGVTTLDTGGDDEPDPVLPDETYRLFDLTIYNELLADGESSEVVLFGDDSSGDPAGRGYLSELPANNKPQMNTYRLNVTAVPEPATMLALGAGAVALLARRRRNK
jgi:hypothetical protein